MGFYAAINPDCIATGDIQVPGSPSGGFLASFSATWTQERNSMPRHHNSVAKTAS
jgi:hypothetical protein